MAVRLPLYIRVSSRGFVNVMTVGKEYLVFCSGSVLSIITEYKTLYLMETVSHGSLFINWERKTHCPWVVGYKRPRICNLPKQ